jgi:hypothetical protein
MNPNDTSRILDAVAADFISDDLNLLPQIAAGYERKSLMKTLRARPALVLVLVLLALALLTGVAYAVGRSLGYIPGLGVVEQGAPFRVLAAPVTVERDGITLTVLQALVSSDKTIVTFKAENIPEAALAPQYREGETPPPACAQNDSLRLPDGTILAPTGGTGSGWQLGFEYRETFPALPADVTRATLLVPCLRDTSPGKAPENWEIALDFVPAPPDLTVVPVLEVSPTPSPATGQAAVPQQSPISIERSIELEDGYILIGSFHAITMPNGVVTSAYPWNVRITDAGGRDVPYQYATDLDLPAGDENVSHWAYQISGKAQAWPLTVSLDVLDASLGPDAQATFEFDTGPAPQAGQAWTLNRDLQIDGYAIHVLTVTRTPDGYAFFFQADPAVQGVAVDIRGYDQYIPPSGGGGGGAGDGSLSAGVAYAGAVPEGNLTVVVGSMSVIFKGSWSAQWAPEDAATTGATATPSGPAACVTDETWKQALAAAQSPLPGGLPGRFLILGPGPNGTPASLSVLDLAASTRSFLFEGAWPVASPDGTKFVYLDGDGLSIYDFANGTSTHLPGTNASDFRMAWSPDGSRIAFVRSDPSNRIMVINADGSGLAVARDNAAVYHLLVGWADRTHLLVTEPGPDGVNIQSLDLANNTTQNLFPIRSNKADTVVSPDGQWIAFTTGNGGMEGNGLFVSRLDGSDRWLVAALYGRALYFPIWSPDDRWLLLSLPDESDPADGMAQALVELDTCRLIRLPGVGGDVYSWGK